MQIKNSHKYNEPIGNLFNANKLMTIPVKIHSTDSIINPYDYFGTQLLPSFTDYIDYCVDNFLQAQISNIQIVIYSSQCFVQNRVVEKSIHSEYKRRVARLTDELLSLFTRIAICLLIFVASLIIAFCFNSTITLPILFGGFALVLFGYIRRISIIIKKRKQCVLLQNSEINFKVIDTVINNAMEDINAGCID